MKLIALDLDGTLFNNKSQISKENIKALQTEVQSTKLTQKNVFTKTAFLMRQRFQ